MAVQFREKALMAYETMPLKQKDKVSKVISKLNSKVISQLDVNKLRPLHSHQLKSQDLDTWVIRVDRTVRLLFTKTDQGFLIIDIIDRVKEDYS